MLCTSSLCDVNVHNVYVIFMFPHFFLAINHLFNTEIFTVPFICYTLTTTFMT